MSMASLVHVSKSVISLDCILEVIYRCMSVWVVMCIRVPKFLVNFSKLNYRHCTTDCYCCKCGWTMCRSYVSGAIAPASFSYLMFSKTGWWQLQLLKLPWDLILWRPLLLHIYSWAVGYGLPVVNIRLYSLMCSIWVRDFYWNADKFRFTMCLHIILRLQIRDICCK